jgi:hypothetical protein
MYVKITRTRVRVTIVAVENKYITYSDPEGVSVALSSIHSACAVLCCHLWVVWLYQSFTLGVINVTIFGIKIIGHKMRALFSSTTAI